MEVIKKEITWQNFMLSNIRFLLIYIYIYIYIYMWGLGVQGRLGIPPRSTPSGFVLFGEPSPQGFVTKGWDLSHIA